MVIRFPSRAASTAEMRPLIAAEPMLRAPRPEIVSESTRTMRLERRDCTCACDVVARPATRPHATRVLMVIGQFSSLGTGFSGAGSGFLAAGAMSAGLVNRA